MEIFNIAIVGVILSGIVQYLKTKYGTSSLANKMITVLLAIILGGGYYLIKESSWWESALGILTSATMFYSFFINGLEKK